MRSALVSAIALCLTAQLHSQVCGQVFDQMGASIAGATVILKSSPDGKEVAKAITDDSGAYSLNADSGDYSIVASAPGFVTVRYEPYTIGGRIQRLDLTLKVADLGGLLVHQLPLDLCQVLSDLPKYMDKTVVIRAEFITHYHGTFLVKDKCQQPLITSGHVWPTMISLDPTPNAEGRPDFGSVSVDAPCRLAMKTAPPGTQLWVTVVGRLETREHFEMVLRGDGKTVPNGYGHLNAYPAQVVYEQMKDCIRKPR